VKKKVGGSKRYKTAIKAKEDGSEPKWTGPAPPKHLQRKIARKVGFLDKVASSAPAKTTSALAAKPVIAKPAHSKQQRKKKAARALASLSPLAGLLDEVERGAQAAKEAGAGGKAAHVFGEGVKSSRARAVIMDKETARLHQVVKHPVFKSDPIAAITNHLKNSLPAPPAPAQPAASKGRSKQKKGGKGGQAAMAVDS